LIIRGFEGKIELRCGNDPEQQPERFKNQFYFLRIISYHFVKGYGIFTPTRPAQAGFGDPDGIH
jgi:hypothetical protein